MNLHRLNLNLLVAFDALMKEKHVSKAGERLFVTQSAMSKMLAQCRELFSDPILVRAANGMHPTEKALALHGQVRKILREVEDVFYGPDVFDPGDFSRTIRIAMPGSVAEFILPKVVSALKPKAPGLNFQIISVDSKTLLANMRSDDIDLAITYGFVLPDLSRSIPLLSDPPVCIASRNHPLMRYKTIPIREYLRFEHIVIVYKDEPVLFGDRILEQKKYSQRKIAMKVANATAVLPILTSTDLILTTGESFAKQYAKKFRLDYRPLAGGLPNIPIHMLWGPSYDESPWHLWLRDEISSIEFC